MELKDHEFLLLRNFISEHFGVYFSDDKRWMLESKLTRIIPVEFKSFLEYYQHLMQKFFVQQSFLEKEIIDLIQAITNHETYFFRENGGLSALREIFSQNATKPMRILSAGCSTGEEVYTVAMMLRDAGIPVFGSGVIGIDLDAEVIKKGSEGIYGTNAFRGVEDRKLYNSIKRYFDITEGPNPVYKVRDDLKKVVMFQQANLVDPTSLELLGMFDVILCRNVLIYFNETERTRTFVNLSKLLKPGGYLFLGHSETLQNTNHELRPVDIAGHLLYQKIKEREESESNIPGLCYAR